METSNLTGWETIENPQVFPSTSNIPQPIPAHFPRGVHVFSFGPQEPFDLSAEFTEDAPLLPMTPRSLGKFRVELPPQTEKKRVKVKARLSLQLGCSNVGIEHIESPSYDFT